MQYLVIFTNLGPGWKSYIGEDGPAERGVVIKKKPDNTVTVRCCKFFLESRYLLNTILT